MQIEAPRIFEQSITHDLRLSEGRGEIELAVGELFEDDGPASGHSYQKPENRETVTNQTWIKKELLIPNLQARAAHLVVLSDVPIKALINGMAQHFVPNQSARPLHQRHAYDPKLLQAAAMTLSCAWACIAGKAAYIFYMPMTNVSMAEEALSLSPAERADLARLLIASLQGDRRTNEEIKVELANRLAQLKSGEDPGVSFDDIFRSAS